MSHFPFYIRSDILNVSTITISGCVNFFYWRKFGAPKIRYFVIHFFWSNSYTFFCVKIQANEGKK